MPDKEKNYQAVVYSPYGIRTRVTAVKRRCLNPLTNGPEALGISPQHSYYYIRYFFFVYSFFKFFTFFTKIIGPAL